MVQLDDISEIIGGPFGTLFEDVSYVDNGIPVVNTRNLGYGEINTRHISCISMDRLGKLSAYRIRERDILVARVGTLGKFAYINKEQEGWIQGTDCICIRCNPEVNARYVAHCFNLDSVREQLQHKKTGGILPAISSKILKNVRIPLLNRKKQDEIERDLTLLLKRMELNNRYKCENEQLLEKFFSHWFLEYQFPNHVIKDKKWSDKLNREIPGNWNVMTLEEVTEQITDGEHSRVEECPGSSYWLYGAGNIKEHQIVVSSSVKQISEEAFLRIRNRTKTSKGDILLTTAGSIGNLIYLQSNLDQIEFQRSVTTIRPDMRKVTPEYLYQYLITAVPQIKALEKGSTQKSVALADLRRMPILVPDIETQECYSKKITPLYSLLEIDRKENLEFQKIYDLMIKKLLRENVGDRNI